MNFPQFVQKKCSIPSLQQPASGAHQEPDHNIFWILPSLLHSQFPICTVSLYPTPLNCTIQTWNVNKTFRLRWLINWLVRLKRNQSEYFHVVSYSGHWRPSASLNRMTALPAPSNCACQQFGISLFKLVALLEQSAVYQQLIKYKSVTLNTWQY